MAELWLHAAQEEAARHYHTINGGWLQPECTWSHKRELVPAVQPFPWKDSLCIYANNLPAEKCHNKKCNFASHPELFTNDECAEYTETGAACRTVQSWLRIANEKLVSAITFYNNCRYSESLSASCVADYLFLQVAMHLTDISAPSSLYRFIDSVARKKQHYDHTNSAGRVLIFLETEGGNGRADIEWLNVQSQRICGKDRTKALVTSLLFYTKFQTASNGVEFERDLQVVYAGTGVAPDFRATFADFDPLNDCALHNEPSSFSPIYQPSWRLAQLTTNDFASVDYDTEARGYIDLSLGSVCPIVVLGDADTKKRNTAVTQINLYEPAAVQDTGQLDEQVLLATIFVDGALDVCKQTTTIFHMDIPGSVCDAGGGGYSAATTVTEQNEGAFVSLAGDLKATIDVKNLLIAETGIPLTLAPGDSQCVGGERHGARCTMPSECDKGWACRRKPFAPRSVAFCHDGEQWDEERPCAFADEDDECPFGECYGAVNGREGGAFPFYYFYTENNCSSTPDSEVCSEPHVAGWSQFPNPKLLVDDGESLLLLDGAGNYKKK